MERHLRRVLFALLVIMAMVVIPVMAAGSENTDHTIVTSATGEVKTTPDRAEISFSVETENQEVTIAQAENARMMTAAIDAISRSGIEKADIQTTGYNIYPVYDDSGTVFSKKVKVYRVVNTIRVTVRDVNRVGLVIDAAVGAGINQVSSISFSLSEDREQALRAEAIRKAVTQTRADADAAAAAAAVNIAGTKELIVSSGYRPVTYANTDSMGYNIQKSVVPTPIQASDVTVSVQVTVTYLIG